MSKRQMTNRTMKHITEREEEEYKKQVPKLFEKMVEKFYDASPYVNNIITNYELEVKFGTLRRKDKGVRPYTKLDYDSVIKKLKSSGFTSMYEEGNYMMRIMYEYLGKSGYYTDSDIRVEVNGWRTIQEYCKTNDIVKLMNTEQYARLVNFVKKSSLYENDKRVDDVDFKAFNFRVSFKKEETFASSNIIIRNTTSNWAQVKKTFRYINRVTFTHPDLPVNIDLSIVRSSPYDAKERSNLKKTYTTDEAGVFSNTNVYEIEIEVDNSRIGPGTPFTTAKSLMAPLRKAIKYVLMGLQGTNYPVSIDEQNDTLIDYMQLLHGPEYNAYKRIYPQNFIGPSSKTLQLDHIIPENDNVALPNIRKNYVVTDKADGERNLMYISPKGKIYLINTNMSVIFTGAITKSEILFNSMFDGELILHNKNHKFINLFAIFDVYYVKGEDVRKLKFIDEDDEKTIYRKKIISNTITLLKPTSVVENEMSPMRFESKKFYPEKIEADVENMQIFAACKHILDNVDNGLYEYETDGLIFTHAYYGVGAEQSGKTGPLKKITWEHSFKWKPPEFNTIDFLVITKKSNGEDKITPIFQPGKSTTDLDQYKTIELRCGFNQRLHGYLNPCQDVYEDKLPEGGDKEDSAEYKPALFVPTNPYDPEAGICNIMLKRDDTGVLQMFTEDGDVFEDNTIVEFKYELDREKSWRWVPIRVRTDKTTELRQGLSPNYGNAYHVAESNWKSIHNPITREMITSGLNITHVEIDEDVYYNKMVKSKKTIGMRSFHNYIKSVLIKAVSKKGDILIDYACGKGGDFPKWIDAKLSFVLGIDKSKDNLENKIDGACARFLNNKRDYVHVPYSLFVEGDSGKNIRNGQAIRSDKGIQIIRAVFGEGGRDEDKLGAGVVRQYGKAVNGFDVSSCQFALHYFFQNLEILQNFVRNLAECTKLGGYFIATSYDGKNVFNMLKNKDKGDGTSIYEDHAKIWEIKKQYSLNTFNDDSSSLDYKIDVFQESINKLQPEYLVNYDYFRQVMEDYGFHPISRDEAKEIGLPDGTGSFSELYTDLVKKYKKSKAKEYEAAVNMNEYEKKISFLNRYVVYKKIRIVNAAKVVLAEAEESADMVIQKEKDVADVAGDNFVIEGEEDVVEMQTEIPEKKSAKNGKKPRKLMKKLVLVDETPST